MMSAPDHLAELRAMRVDLAATIETTPDPILAAEAEELAAATGGTLVRPTGGGWGPHEFSLSIWGLNGQHPTLHGALRDWAKAARREAAAAGEEAA